MPAEFVESEDNKTVSCLLRQRNRQLTKWLHCKPSAHLDGSWTWHMFCMLLSFLLFIVNIKISLTNVFIMQQIQIKNPPALPLCKHVFVTDMKFQSESVKSSGCLSERKRFLCVRSVANPLQLNKGKLGKSKNLLISSYHRHPVIPMWGNANANENNSNYSK